MSGAHRLTVAVSVPCREWLAAVPEARGLCRRAARAALAESGLDLSGAELSVLLTDDTAIRELNRTWRGRDAATDVLSFAAAEIVAGRGLPAAERPVLLGDVVVAFGTASADAGRNATDLADHLAHLVVHGVLHILGHDHEDPVAAGEMEGLEAAALDRIGLADPYAATPRRGGVDGDDERARRQ